jgi:hypothetical protein
VSGDLTWPLIVAIRQARVRHAKAVDTLPDGEVDDLDEMGRTLDRAIAEAVLAMPEMQAPR